MYFLTAIKRLTISQDRLSHRNDEAKAKKTRTHTPTHVYMTCAFMSYYSKDFRKIRIYGANCL